MVEIAINNSKDKRLVIDKGETYDSARGPNYSFETIMRIQKELPDSKLFLILGDDQFVNFRTWKNWEWILQNINLAVCNRPHNGMGKQKIISTFSLNEFRDSFKEKIFLVDLKPDASSSTMVRGYLKKNMGLDNMVDVDVFEYIKRSKLYQD
jgi:nicotinate-nucleotide adenylyltransferase